MMTEEDIKKLEAAGGKRWQKYGKDRIYIDATTLGLKVDYYNTGNIRHAEWQGETVSNANGRRLLGSKVYVDCADGSLHVRTDYYSSIDEDANVENVAKKFVEASIA